MAGSGKDAGLTLEIQLGMLQDDLVGLQRMGRQVLTGAVDWHGKPALVILLPCVRTEQAQDGLKLVEACHDAGS